MVNLERLRELAEVVLPNVPEEDFNLVFWHCGTAACAVGWACKHQSFIEQGLGLEPTGLSPEVGADFFPVFAAEHGKVSKWGAVDHFFGLEGWQSNLLFDEGCYEIDYTKQDVIDRILEFIRKEESQVS